MIGREPHLVSVVIPAYNAEKSVARAIQSALAQSYPHVEIIVINDGSTDGTESIVRSFAGRVRYIRQENLGEPAARNRGFSLARGEFVTLIDHDGRWERSFIQDCVDFLRRHPQAVAVSAGQDHQFALKPDKTFRP